MRTPLGLAVLGTLVLGCGSASGGTAAGLKGKVMRGPTQPVCFVSEPCEKPARGVTLVFTRSGKVVARTKTDQKGWYRVTLRPGRYAVRSSSTGPEQRPVSEERDGAEEPRQARRLRHRYGNPLADHEVHELARDDDLLADLLAVQELLNPRRRARLRDQLFL